MKDFSKIFASLFLIFSIFPGFFFFLIGAFSGGGGSPIGSVEIFIRFAFMSAPIIFLVLSMGLFFHKNWARRGVITVSILLAISTFYLILTEFYYSKGISIIIFLVPILLVFISIAVYFLRKDIKQQWSAKN